MLIINVAGKTGVIGALIWVFVEGREKENVIVSFSFPQELQGAP